jgi:hypothetical protein
MKNKDINKSCDACDNYWRKDSKCICCTDRDLFTPQIPVTFKPQPKVNIRKLVKSVKEYRRNCESCGYNETIWEPKGCVLEKCIHEPKPTSEVVLTIGIDEDTNPKFIYGGDTYLYLMKSIEKGEYKQYKLIPVEAK